MNVLSSLSLRMLYPDLKTDTLPLCHDHFSLAREHFEGSKIIKEDLSVVSYNCRTEPQKTYYLSMKQSWYKKGKNLFLFLNYTL